MAVAQLDHAEVQVTLHPADVVRFGLRVLYHPLTLTILTSSSVVATLLMVQVVHQRSFATWDIQVWQSAGIVAAQIVAVGLLVLAPVLVALLSWLNWLLGATGREHLAYRVESEGLEVRTEARVVLVRWGAIQRAVETSREFLLYQGPFVAHIVPKRAFFVEGDMSRFRSALVEHLATRAQLR